MTWSKNQLLLAANGISIGATAAPEALSKVMPFLQFSKMATQKSVFRHFLSNRQTDWDALWNIIGSIYDVPIGSVSIKQSEQPVSVLCNSATQLI